LCIELSACQNCSYSFLCMYSHLQFCDLLPEIPSRCLCVSHSSCLFSQRKLMPHHSLTMGRRVDVDPLVIYQQRPREAQWVLREGWWKEVLLEAFFSSSFVWIWYLAVGITDEKVSTCNIKLKWVGKVYFLDHEMGEGISQRVLLSSNIDNISHRYHLIRGGNGSLCIVL
jgi:hypothetical protein